MWLAVTMVSGDAAIVRVKKKRIDVDDLQYLTKVSTPLTFQQKI